MRKKREGIWSEEQVEFLRSYNYKTNEDLARLTGFTVEQVKSAKYWHKVEKYKGGMTTNEAMALVNISRSVLRRAIKTGKLKLAMKNAHTNMFTTEALRDFVLVYRITKTHTCIKCRKACLGDIYCADHGSPNSHSRVKVRDVDAVVWGDFKAQLGKAMMLTRTTRKKLTTHQLGEICGYAHNSIRRYENGRGIHYRLYAILTITNKLGILTNINVGGESVKINRENFIKEISQLIQRRETRHNALIGREIKLGPSTVGEYRRGVCGDMSLDVLHRWFSTSGESFSLTLKEF